MKTFFLLITSLPFIFSLNAQTALEGKITDKESGEELIGANIVLEKNGVYIIGNSTDFNGRYKLIIDPGTYDLRVTSIGYPENLITGVVVKPRVVTKLDVQLQSGVCFIPLCVSYHCKISLIEPDNTTSGDTKGGETIRDYPTRNVQEMLINAPGVSLSRF